MQQKHIWKDKLYKTKWLVYCKSPFKSTAFVLGYLRRFLHRIVIYNNRIVNIENEFVTFKLQDYKDDNKEKFMTLEVAEIFVTHITL